MTQEQLQAEMAYHASLAPFTCLLKDSVISAEDYAKIKTIDVELANACARYGNNTSFAF